jgi:hypothetical protein
MTVVGGCQAAFKLGYTADAATHGKLLALQLTPPRCVAGADASLLCSVGRMAV